MDNEIWKDIDGFSDYQVSNKGNVRSSKSGKWKTLKQYSIAEYLGVSLFIDGKRQSKKTHRLVLESFKGLSDGLVANHINENKHDNIIENLEWISVKENVNHGTRNIRAAKSISLKMRKYVYSRVDCSGGVVETYTSKHHIERTVSLRFGFFNPCFNFTLPKVFSILIQFNLCPLTKNNSQIVCSVKK